MKIMILVFSFLFMSACGQREVTSPSPSEISNKGEEKIEFIEKAQAKAEVILKRALSQPEIEQLAVACREAGVYSERDLENLIANFGRRHVHNKIQKASHELSKVFSRHDSKRLLKNLNTQPYEGYVVTPDVAETLEIMEEAFADGLNVLLVGPTGSGKSEMAEYYAYKFDMSFERINFQDNMTGQILLGRDGIGHDGRPDFIPGKFTRAIQKKSLVLLDEMNLSPSPVVETLNGPLDTHERAIYVNGVRIEVHPETRFVGAINSHNEEGRKVVNDSILNRFVVIPVEEMKKDLLEKIVRKEAQKYSFFKNPNTQYLISALVDTHIAVATAASPGGGQQALGLIGGPFVYTLRDMMRVIKRVGMINSFSDQELKEGGAKKLALPKLFIREIQEVYGDRFVTDGDKLALEATLTAHFARFFNNSNEVLDDLDVVPAITDKGNAVQFGDFIVTKRLGGPLVPKTNRGIVLTKQTRIDITRLAKAVLMGETPMIVGETSLGKSLKVSYIAHLLNMNYVRIGFNEDTHSSELLGRPTAKRDENRKAVPGQFVWEEGILVKAIKMPDTLVVLDEPNTADPSMVELLNPLVDKGKLINYENHSEEVVMHPGTRLFMTMNPPDNHGRNFFSNPWRNRSSESRWKETTDPEEARDILAGTFFPGRLFAEIPDHSHDFRIIIEESAKFYLRWKTEHAAIALTKLDMFVPITQRNLTNIGKTFKRVFADPENGIYKGEVPQEVVDEFMTKAANETFSIVKDKCRNLKASVGVKYTMKEVMMALRAQLSAGADASERQILTKEIEGVVDVIVDRIEKESK